MRQLRSVKPIPWWVWPQYPIVEAFTFRYAHPWPLVTGSMSVILLAAVICEAAWFKRRDQRWQWQELERGRIRAEVVEPQRVLPSGRPALTSGVPVRSQRVG